MSTHYKELLANALRDVDNGWSVGTFGAVAEFIRDRGEPHTSSSQDGCTQIVTARGGIRVTPRDDLAVLAYNTFPGQGDTWGNEVAFCLPAKGPQAKVEARAIRCLGPDHEALRPQDRDALLFDIGAGIGEVRFCVRTADPELIAALRDAEGADPLGAAAAPSNALTVKLSPARIGISPLARIEVYSHIPPPGGVSPLGPHTHLLPRLVARGRTHSANAPIAAGLQPVLMMHPPSPWRDNAGKPIPYDRHHAEHFDALLAQFGLEEDQRLKRQLEEALRADARPRDFPAPMTRHGRTQLRILLRRMAQEIGPEAAQRSGPSASSTWKAPKQGHAPGPQALPSNIRSAQPRGYFSAPSHPDERTPLAGIRAINAHPARSGRPLRPTEGNRGQPKSDRPHGEGCEGCHP